MRKSSRCGGQNRTQDPDRVRTSLDQISAEPKKWMKAIWEISRDYRNSRWVGVCPALQLTVEAETLPELRKSIRKAEGGPKLFHLGDG